MMKKAITILMIILICSISISVFATGDLDPSKIKGNATGEGATEIRNFGSKIIGLIQTAGSVVSVAVLVVVGIKYMMGSAEEKAEYKKVMIPYVLGAVLVFAASNVAGMIYKFAK